jgi:very-short-patch-repair endonuclease
MQGKRAERAIVRAAERQYGLITRAQLIALGIGPGAIEHRVRLGRLHRLHRGVYAVGQRRLPREARWLAAVLTYGPDGVLSHRAGGAHWQLIRDAGWCEVATPVRRRPRRGVLVHEARLRADEVTVHKGIPVTTVPRTLFDLAALLSPRQLERAINEAEVRHLWDELSLEHLLHRYPRRAGNRTVRAALHARRGGTTITRSELEEAFIELVDKAGLPRPEINALVEGYEVDAVWRAARLVVELDGRDTHGTAAAFETDRERDRHLVAAGWRPIRVTSRQMSDTRDRLIADLRGLIGFTMAA